jgi:hypothetical protein
LMSFDDKMERPRVTRSLGVAYMPPALFGLLVVFKFKITSVYVN